MLQKLVLQEIKRIVQSFVMVTWGMEGGELMGKGTWEI